MNPPPQNERVMGDTMTPLRKGQGKTQRIKFVFVLILMLTYKDLINAESTRLVIQGPKLDSKVFLRFNDNHWVRLKPPSLLRKFSRSLKGRLQLYGKDVVNSAGL